MFTGHCPAFTANFYCPSNVHSNGQFDSPPPTEIKASSFEKSSVLAHLLPEGRSLLTAAAAASCQPCCQRRPASSSSPAGPSSSGRCWSCTR